MDQMELDAILTEHGKWLRGEGGKRAYLTGADLDFACWPLWCGSVGVTVDARIFRQLLGHVLALKVEGAGATECRKVQEMAAVHKCAAKGHRAKELGI